MRNMWYNKNIKATARFQSPVAWPQLLMPRCDMDIIPQKCCPKCSILKPVSDFGKNKCTADGLQYYCKDCASVYRKQNRQRLNEYFAIYRREHSDRRVSYNRGWVARNKGKAVEYQREYRRRNRPKMNEHNRRWQKANHGYLALKTHHRRTQKKQNGGSYTLAEWVSLCTRYDNRCLCCGEQRPLTVDHIVPVHKGGSNDIANLQPLCGECNSRKGARVIDYRPDR